MHPLIDVAPVITADNYTRESGVRNLERSIGAVCRAVAVKVKEEGGRGRREGGERRREKREGGR